MLANLDRRFGSSQGELLILKPAAIVSFRKSWVLACFLISVFAGLLSHAVAQSDVSIEPPSPTFGETVTANFFLPCGGGMPNPDGELYDIRLDGSEFVVDFPISSICVPPGLVEMEIALPIPGPGEYQITAYMVPHETIFPAEPEDRSLYAELAFVVGLPQAVPIPTLGLWALVLLMALIVLLAGWVHWTKTNAAARV